MDKQLLVIDAIIDLVLGLVLIAFPRELIKLVGAPPVENAFYPSLLGAVVFGIGVALLIECFSGPNGPYGLGLAGALAINLCGGIALGSWLIFGELSLPRHGEIALWALAGILFILSFFELISHWWKKA
ncbi:MAG: hypothetical protein PVH45_00465 [Candidatus Omnitrophota bacterium]|jgi:hypothetical protein